MGCFYPFVACLDLGYFTAFIRYCLISSCFLLSISEVPREYLPIGLAGYLHFSLRILHDWSYFEMVGRFFNYGPRLMQALRAVFLSIVGVFFLQFVWISLTSDQGGFHGSQAFDSGFLMLRIVFPLLFIPHLLGLLGAIEIRKTWEGRLSIPLFIMTLFFQIRDTLIYHALWTGVYFVKWYPFIIGLVFGLFFLERARAARAKAHAEREQMKQMASIKDATISITHEMEEPLRSLEMACKELKRCPNNLALINAIADTFPPKLHRIYELRRSVLKYAKELSQPVELKLERVNILKFLQTIADEYRSDSPYKEIEVAVLVDDPGRTFIVDPFHIKNVVRNLVSNASQACTGQENARIEIAATMTNTGTTITVSDNGPGVHEKIRVKLFQPFETYGKENGTGLGLAMSRWWVEAHGGEVTLLDSLVGATFQIYLPNV